MGGTDGMGGDFCAAAAPPLAGASAATPGSAARHSIAASSAPNATGMMRKRTNWLGIRAPEKSWFMALDGARWHGGFNISKASGRSPAEVDLHAIIARIFGPTR
jgi:hypothetical protein